MVLVQQEVASYIECKVTCLYTVLGPIARHYALNYGFHTFQNLLKNLLERHVALFMYTNA